MSSAGFRRWLLWAGGVVLLSGSVGAAPAIPDRPEKLQFPPLQYQPPRPADYRVVLSSGPVVYLAEDRELPLVNIDVTVRVGDYLDPQGQEGLADLAGSLLVRGGAGSRPAETLDERLAFLAALMSSAVNETEGSVQMNVLSKDLDEGFGLLRDVLTAPRFQEDRVRLRKQQILQAMKRRNDEAADIHQRELRFLVYGDNFFRNRHATAASIQSIEIKDLAAFHRRWFVPAHFVFAVSGDFDRADMIRRLEALCAGWPFKGESPPPVPTNTEFAKPGLYLVDKDVNQGRVAILLPGLDRDDPDFVAGTVMNDILGGGGFSSRLLNRVRSDEGLAYSAGSVLSAGSYYVAPFAALFESKSATVAYATSIMLEEMRKLSEAPVTDEELATTKQSMIETFPRRFSSKRRVVSIFADDEFTGRYAKRPDYWDRYRAQIQAVGKAEVQQVAKRLLDLKKSVILVVGQKAAILAGDPAHDAKLTALSSSPLVELPLRDPLTMLPMALPKPASP